VAIRNRPLVANESLAIVNAHVVYHLSVPVVWDIGGMRGLGVVLHDWKFDPRESGRELATASVSVLKRPPRHIE
jgi:hypothetical protein